MKTSLLEKLVPNPINFSLCVSIHCCPKMPLDFSLTTVCSGVDVHLHLCECSSSPAVIGDLFHITVFGKDTLCDFSLKSVKD